ncbi:MAG: hypothetical protein QW228_00895 [Candidatus Aenigmatarchaeota archaeon]
MEQLFNRLLEEVHLVIGGAIVFFLMFPLKKIITKYVNEEYSDIFNFFMAVILAVVYGVVQNSFFAGLEALAGSQMIFALLHKGLRLDI